MDDTPQRTETRKIRQVLIGLFVLLSAGTAFLIHYDEGTPWPYAIGGGIVGAILGSIITVLVY